MSTEGAINVNLRWDSEEQKFVPNHITAEPFTIGPIEGQPGKYGFWLKEIPLRPTDPTTTSIPSPGMVISGFTYTANTPAAGEFKPDWFSDGSDTVPYRRALVYCSAADDGTSGTVEYYGGGAAGTYENWQRILDAGFTVTGNLTVVGSLTTPNITLDGVDVGDWMRRLRLGVQWELVCPMDSWGGGSYEPTGIAINEAGTVWVMSLWDLGAPASKVYSSSDGITWTERTHGAGATARLQGVWYGNGVFVLLDVTLGKIFTSTDGITWTERLDAAQPFRAARYLGGLWIAVGDVGQLYTSTDGITWTSRTSTFGANPIYGIAYDGTTWLLVGSGAAATSTDGITWTAQTIPVARFTRCVWDDAAEVFVCAGMNAGSAYLYTTPDGATYTEQRAGAELIWDTSAGYGGMATDGIGRTVIGSRNLMYSDNALNGFICATTPLQNNIASAFEVFDVQYYNGAFYAAGNLGGVQFLLKSEV